MADAKFKCPFCKWNITGYSYTPGHDITCANCSKVWKSVVNREGKPELRDEVKPQ